MMATRTEDRTRRASKTGSALQRVMPRSRSARFVMLFAALVAAFYAAWPTDWFQHAAVEPTAHAYAFVGSLLLNVAGFDTQASLGTIASSDYSISVKRGCDALEPMALFAAALIAFPGSLHKKLRMLAVGLLALACLNLVRVDSLFLIGRTYPDWFEVAHIDVWQAVFVIAPVLVCVFAVTRVATAASPPSPA